jgi:outer membrane protein OmpA-like peptidoglycan-associated protein
MTSIWNRWALVCAFLFSATVGMAASAWAGEIKQVGAKPDPNELIQLLTPAPGEVQGGPDRGIRVLSGKKPSASDTGHSSEGAATDDRGPAVALDIHFDTGSDALNEAALDTVGRIATALQSSQLASYRFLIEGHTDSVGSPDSNLTLSRRRAEAVKAYLVATAGIAANRLETAGKGASEPIDPDHRASAINRRVQIINLGPQHES